MTLRDYCVGAGHTDHITPEMASKGYYTFGLCGESSEMLETILAPEKNDDFPYECGDVLWYCARLLHSIGGMNALEDKELNNYFCLRLDESSKIVNGDIMKSCCNASIFAGSIADRQKKILRDRNGVYTEKDVSEIISKVYAIIANLANAAVLRGLDLEKIACMNLGKLASREARGVISGSGDHR